MDADVVLSTMDVFPPNIANALQQQSNTPVFLQRYASLADIPAGIRGLGSVMHCEPTANRIADSIQRITEKVEAATKGQIKYGTLMIVSTEPTIRAVGGVGLLHELIELSGGRNVLSDKKQAYITLTPEQMVQLQPEYLIIPTKNDQIYAALISQNPVLTAMPAEVQHHIFLVDSDYYVHPGPRTLSALLQLTQILHTNLTPDKFIEAPKEGTRE
jgi:ABC-type Fe3+-hydroxamate transport system substrate-binding protein